MTARPQGLPSYAIFAAVLAAAGLPIYIHAPKYFVDEYGVSLAALGAVLFGLRLLDVVQDPVLGWLSRKLEPVRGAAVLVVGGVMALAMVGLFAIAPPVPPLLWFAITLALLFSAFSFLTITFYAQGVQKADDLGADGHVRLATWRETGSLLGISAAAVLPILLLSTSDSPFALFAGLFAGAVALALIAMRSEWQDGVATSETSIAPILRDPLARRLLLIALLNATPVAVTSTLFLFFVESRLGAPGWEGPLLLLFFLSAAASAPIWGRIASIIGAKPALMAGMALAIISFGGAAFLGTGDAMAFAVICIASGAALGADMTLLPAIFARRLATIAPAAAEGFGLWSFVTKFTLAFAAITLLPVLEVAGFPSGTNPAPISALTTLTLMYAVLPCALKLVALTLLALTPLETPTARPALQEA
ncbi:MAG: sugar:cation symporter [Boseongicola sp.]|nr:MAG: sugar:cation symporter [Boseongicola sp.]